MNSPYLEGHMDGLETIGDSVEQLMELEPDLIITLNRTRPLMRNTARLLQPFRSHPSLSQH